MRASGGAAWKLAVGIVLWGLAWPAPAADTLVVCAYPLRQALQPWIAHRVAQGHRIAVVTPRATVADTVRAVRRQAADGSVRFVLLVGDTQAAPGIRQTGIVPTGYVSSQVGVLWGSEPQIATDHVYADLDGDGLPEAAVGRLPVDSPQELSVLVRRILDYERSTDFSTWRRNVHVVAGMGGFGAIADLAIETGARQLLTYAIPAAYHVTMTYGNWRSPYFPDPQQFQAMALRRLSEGGVFWVYIGHGHRRHLEDLRLPDGEYRVLHAEDARRLSAATGGPPIALLLTCYAAAFDGPRDALAEDLLRADGGPIAVIGGSRVTMPYGMGVLAVEMLDEYFTQRRATLGEVFLHAKRNTLLKPRTDHRSKLLDTLGGMLCPKGVTLHDERREHLALMNLLGDPLLRLPQPAPLRLDVAASAAAGSRLEIAGHSPIDGVAVVELAVRRDRLRFAPPRRTKYAADEASRAEFQQTYRLANEPRLTQTRARVSDGRFRAELAIPDDAAGPCWVRVFVEGDRACALGAAELHIERPARLTAAPRTAAPAGMQ